MDETEGEKEEAAKVSLGNSDPVVHKPGIRGICASHINTASIKDKKAEPGNLLLSADMNLTGIIANYWGEDNQDTIKL